MLCFSIEFDDINYGDKFSLIKDFEYTCFAEDLESNNPNDKFVGFCLQNAKIDSEVIGFCLGTWSKGKCMIPNEKSEALKLDEEDLPHLNNIENVFENDWEYSVFKYDNNIEIIKISAFYHLINKTIKLFDKDLLDLDRAKNVIALFKLKSFCELALKYGTDIYFDDYS